MWRFTQPTQQCPHLFKHQEHCDVPAAQACKVWHEAIVEGLQRNTQRVRGSTVQHNACSASTTCLQRYCWLTAHCCYHALDTSRTDDVQAQNGCCHPTACSNCNTAGVTTEQQRSTHQELMTYKHNDGCCHPTACSDCNTAGQHRPTVLTSRPSLRAVFTKQSSTPVYLPLRSPAWANDEA